MTAAVRVESVEVGRRCADSATFLLHVDAGREIEMAYRFWLLHGPGGIIAVDTGIDPDEAARRGITGIVPTERALAERGIDPANIGTLILTHLHWDHVSALDAFPAAEVWLSGPRRLTTSAETPCRPTEFGRTGPQAVRPLSDTRKAKAAVGLPTPTINALFGAVPGPFDGPLV